MFICGFYMAPRHVNMFLDDGQLPWPQMGFDFERRKIDFHLNACADLDEILNGDDGLYAYDVPAYEGPKRVWIEVRKEK